MSIQGFLCVRVLIVISCDLLIVARIVPSDRELHFEQILILITELGFGQFWLTRPSCPEFRGADVATDFVGGVVTRYVSE